MNTFNDFLNESKITLKRQYTNNHPAITVGKTASIRNRMLEAIKDGKLTQEEFTAILKEASVDSNRWMKRNARFFSITEDGVTLTKIGNRTLAAITVNESVVNEKVKETTEAEGRNWKVGTLDHPKFGKITTFKFMTNDNVWIQLSTRQPLEDQDNFMIADGGSAYNTSWSLNDKNVKKMAKDLQELSLRLQNDSFMNLGKSGEGKYKGKEVKLKDYVDAVEAWVELKDSLLSESVVTEAITAALRPFYRALNDSGNLKRYDGPKILGSRPGNTPTDELIGADEEDRILFGTNGNKFGIKSVRGTNLPTKLLKSLGFVEGNSFTKGVEAYKPKGDDMIYIDLNNMQELVAAFDPKTNYSVEESAVTESDEPKCTNRKGHLYKQIDKDGTVECTHCGLRNSLSESVTANYSVEESVVNESEAENILNDLLDERGGDMGELYGMEMEDALDTVEAYGHKGSKAKKIAQELFALTNESNKNSIQEGRAFAAAAKKAKDSDEEEFEFNGKKFPVTIKEKKVVTEWLHTNFSNFTSTLNEAFSSQLLASLFKKENGKLDNSLAKAFYGKTKIAMDKVQDEDLISTTPSAAYKAKGGNTITFYISDNEKNNIYASEDAGYYNKTIPGGGYLLAVTSGDNKFYDNAWANRYTATDKSRTLVERPNKSNDTIGISKKYKGWDGTGLYNVKRISEVADRAVVVNVDLLQQKYSTTNKRDERNAAKSGATAFKSDKDFKAENKNRYEIILQNKAAKLPLDKIVADAIDLLTDQIKQGLAKGEKGKYGDLIIGISPNGRETKMRDASNHMSNILDNYARYVDYVKQEEDSVAQYGQSESWYARSIKQYAKAIKDGVDKIESFNYAW